MKLFSRAFRFLRIHWILAKYRIDDAIFESHPLLLVRIISCLNPFNWFSKKNQPRAERIRLAIEALGPIFVKAGQILSTRRDLLPDDIVNELALLQDQVPPFSSKTVVKLIETAWKQPVSERVMDFQSTPLASASIAQVHAATLKNGESVVIKVLRPRIQQLIDQDIDLLFAFASLLERVWKPARLMKPREIVLEIAQTLHDECDLMREAANASQLKRNAKGNNALHIPTIYWDYSSHSVLVMERIHGIPIQQTERLQSAGVDLAALAKSAIEIFFTQIFRDSFFHADLHPGNLFVDVTHPKSPQLIMVDFGIVASLNQDDQRYIAENLVAFFKRDYQRVAELHIESGWLSPDTRIDQFEGAIRSVSEPILEQPLSKVSFAQLLLRLFQVARRFQINIQPQLVLLQKTLMNIEGLTRQLAPDLDLWTEATPHIEKWLKRQVGLKAFFKRIKSHLSGWSEELPSMPNLVFELLKETKSEKERKRFEQQTTRLAQHSSSNDKRYFIYGVMFSVVVGSLFYMGFY